MLDLPRTSQSVDQQMMPGCLRGGHRRHESCEGATGICGVARADDGTGQCFLHGAAGNGEKLTDGR